MGFKYDFSGWATKNDLLCSDGRTIRRDAFKDNDGKVVPLIWNHDHTDPSNVLGHALLKNVADGIYAYGSFNSNPKAREAATLLAHGDIKALSIWANKLQQRGGDVLHGDIKEVSLVLAGANPAAIIDSVMVHGEESDEEAIIYTGESICHSSGELKDEFEETEDAVEHADDKADELEKSDDDETVSDVFETLSEKQKNVVYALIAEVISENKGEENEDNKEEDSVMKHNVFEQQNGEQQENVLCHADVKAAFDDAKRYGSLKDSFVAHGLKEVTYMAHADGDYGIKNIDYLFPEARNVNNTIDFIKREDSWVRDVMSRVHRSPFSRIKSVHANITEDEARAKGYIKGNMKKEEVFTLLKRSTTPTTVYKKQKLDRDDVLDITDLDTVALVKGEMRGMLDEEIARAALVGDGRSASDDDKINEVNIRPIWTDADLYSIKVRIAVAADDDDNKKATNFIRAAIKSRKNFRGSGKPVLYTTEDMLSDMLLLTDTTGRDIYDTEEKLCKKLRVSEIITVPVMEGLTRTVDTKTRTLAGIIVNLQDYNIGADKGGSVNMFEDFDIDYNQMKYLIETRCSGALTKPYSAMVLEFEAAS